MDFKSRLLTTAFTLPLLTSLSLAPTYAFDITGDSDDANPTATVQTGATPAPADAENIIINGSPGIDDAAVLIDSDTTVTIDGSISIRDRSSSDDDATTYTLENAIGIKLDNELTGANTIRLKSDAVISIEEVLGPDTDEDEDGILEGASALGTFQRIGLWINETIEADLIGEGGFIRIDGNNARGVQIDSALEGDFDFSTAVHNGDKGGILGDDAVGVSINANIDGYYRQRGAIDVRGEDSVGIKINSGVTVDDGTMIDAHINATGYSLIVSGTDGGPDHGRDETDLDDDEVAANRNERRRGGAAVDIAGNLSGGLIIGGKVNRVLTRAESDELADIIEAGKDENGDRIDITGGSTRSTPVHFDGSRPQHYTGQSRDGTVSLTSYGEADDTATLKITGNVGTADGGSIETLLDLTDDDVEVDGNGVPDPDIYTRGSVGLKQFYFSYGLMNRGSIEADGQYDGFKADAVLFDGDAEIRGGVYNSGTIKATANNQNATAIEFDDIKLTDGLRDDGSVFLNEGQITANVSTHAGADPDLADDTYTATAILLTGDVSFEVESGQVGTFFNRGFIDTSAAYVDADDDESDGKNTIAIDASAVTVDFNFTQELLKADRLLDPDDDDNSASNPYIGGGDTDIDSAGAIDGGKVAGDGVINGLDISVPRMTGDVKFGDGANTFAVSAGEVEGDISFGGGNDVLALSNEIPESANLEAAPITRVTGSIANSSGNLNVTIADRTQLHLVAQEDEEDILAINQLTLSGSGDLKFTIDPDNLENELLDVTTLSLSDDAKLTPGLTSLFAVDAPKTVQLIAYDTLTKNNDDINSYLADDTPFIYDVSLSDDDADKIISARFSIKSVADLGINQTEGAALAAVIDHFSKDENSALETRLTGLEDGDDFRDAYRQLFPHYSDGTAQQLAVLAEASTGAVSQHLQLVAAGGRRGGDGWLQQFGDYRRQDSGNDNGTVSGTSYGLAFGYDFPLGAIEAMGLYAQMNFTAVNEKTTLLNEVKSQGSTFGAYIADRIGPLRYELNAAYGLHDLESERYVNFSGYGTASNNRVLASWDATSTAASARLAYPILEDTHLLRLEAGVDYFNLAHDDYIERQPVLDQGLSMQLKGGESEKISQFIGLRGSRQSGGGDPVSIVWEPSYYLGYRTLSDETPYTATANFVGSSETFTLENFVESEDALDIGFGVAAHNDYFAFEFNYRGQFSDGVATQGGGVSIRLLF